MRVLARRVLWAEPFIVLMVVYAFWFAEQNRIWTLLLLIPLLTLRWIAYGRLLTSTPLNGFLLAFLLLAVLNIFIAPMSRGNFTLTVPFVGTPLSVPWAVLMLGRPVMGMAVFFLLVEFARLHGMRPVLFFTVLLALGLAILALVSTQWNSKSDLLRPLIGLLPIYRRLPIAQGGFNANEIAGGLIWLAPFCAALTFHRWPPLRLTAWTAFCLLALAIFLGQSRLAIIGLMMSLVFVIFCLIPRGHWRALALLALALFVALEAAVVLNLFPNPTPGGTSPSSAAAIAQARDEESNLGRFEMWAAVAGIVRDHPLTGIGANMFRDVQVRQVYPVPGYENGGPPHAHNEVLQIAADLGIPGVLVLVAWYGVIIAMLVKIWRHGDPNARIVAVATGAGLLGHAVFGMGDAVALWDRFIWVFWWLVGIAGGQYVLVRETLPRTTHRSTANAPSSMPGAPLEDATPV